MLSYANQKSWKRPTKKAGRAEWGEITAIKSDDDDDDFLYEQSSVYDLNPVDESDDSLSDSSYHDNYKHDNLSSELLCQDEETNSESDCQDTPGTNIGASGSDIGASGSDDANPGPVILPNDKTTFSSTP